MEAVLETNLDLPNKRSGKVRDLYDVTLATKPIFQLLDLQPELTSPPQAQAVDRPAGSLKSPPTLRHGAV